MMTKNCGPLYLSVYARVRKRSHAGGQQPVVDSIPPEKIPTAGLRCPGMI
jgi:hypothetical protein